MINFRAATIDDVPVISRLVEGAFDPRFGEAWHSGQLLGTMALPGTRADLVYDDGSLAGFTLIRSVVDEVELLLIAVDAGRRRTGIGSLLLGRVIELAREQQSKQLHLEVREGNIPAYKLYTAHNFTCVGKRKSYYYGKSGDTFDAVTMSLTL